MGPHIKISSNNILLNLSVLLFTMADSKPQTRSCSIVKSFPATTFQPRIGPFGFYSNNHYQTIIGSEALQQKITGAEYPRYFISFDSIYNKL
jgi:hypothetical protein